MNKQLVYLLLLSIGNVLQAADYYWVGDSGNWSDISHWATTSGGSTFHNQAPTSDDDVFFDANSFSSPGHRVTINADIAFCRNMDWSAVSQQPKLIAGPTRTLNVYGSLILHEDMVLDFSGDVKLLATQAGQKIDAAGHSLCRTLTVEGGGGEWILQSPLKVDSLIELRKGILRTAGHRLQTTYMDIRIAQSGGLDLDDSELILLGRTRYAVNPRVPALYLETTSLTMIADQATIKFTAAVADLIVLGDQPAINLGRLQFSNPIGQSTIEVDPAVTLSLRALRFANSGALHGRVNSKRVFLTAGCRYIFESGTTYQVGELQAPGQCEAPIQLFSTVSGAAAFLQSTGGAIDVSFSSIKDLHAQGSDFVADQSANLGNTNGWEISGTAQTDLYWVGGSGRWNDPAHWSFSSGGIGGACVPTGKENVYFDKNSFSGSGDTVYLNTENALCRNMSWKGARGRPVLEGAEDRQLRVFGSLELIENMEIPFEGDWHFEANTSGNTLKTANHLLPGNLTFNGQGGAWSLRDGLSVTKFISLLSGALSTNEQPVACERFLSTGMLVRQLLLGSSHILLRQADQSSVLRQVRFELSSDNLIFDAGSSRLEFMQHGQLRTEGGMAINYFTVIFNDRGLVQVRDPAQVYVHDLTFAGIGTFTGPAAMGTLRLSAGYEYFFEHDEQYEIGALEAEGSCDALIYVHSDLDDVPAFVLSNQALSGSYLILRDLHNLSPQAFTAAHSIDEGGNQNWQIETQTPRRLYWVGGAGQWEDRAHWSLSSGGPGGECIPTPIDDVFFDANSFSAMEQIVQGSLPQQYCHNIIWQDISTTPRLELMHLLVFGSLQFAPEMVVAVSNLRFAGDGAGNTIDTRGHYIPAVRFEGGGDWKLTHDYYGESAVLTNGFWQTNGHTVDLNDFLTYGEEVPKKLNLGNSHIRLHGTAPIITWSVTGPVTLEAESSFLEFTAARPTMFNNTMDRRELAFNKVGFTAKRGLSTINIREETPLRFHHLQFNNDGVIFGAHTYDTLVFAPGKAYQLQADDTQTIIDHWQIKGNNCIPIQLSSTETGVPATVTMAGGQVDGDFIQMRDQIATGGAEFFAGAHSINVDNSNEGWIFDNAEDYIDIGFLGEDVVLCRQTSLVLDADNKSFDESYRWQDGTQAATYTVNGPGVYWAEVSFANNCTIRDSVQIIPPEDFIAALGPDTTLCTDETLMLDATFPALGVTYLWQDSSSHPVHLVDQPGRYRVAMELSGCVVSDSIEIAYFDPPVVDIGADRTLCFGDQLEVAATLNAAVGYQWQDSTTTARYLIEQAGTYWVDVDFAHCIRRDSLIIEYYEQIPLDLGTDTTLCAGEILPLSAQPAQAIYRWQDGSETADFTVTNANIYWVDVTVNDCTVRDSLIVQYTPLPEFDLGPDQRPCEDEVVQLWADVPAATYHWQDGSTGPSLSVTNDGTYWLDVTAQACTRRDSVQIDYVIFPDDLLGEDQILCDGEVMALDAGFADAVYRWQDGTTSPTYEITSGGRYAVELQVAQCQTRDEINVVFNPTPFFSLGNDTLLCQGQSLALRINAAADEYLWSTGAVAAGIDMIQTDELVWAEARLDACAFRDTIAVRFQAPPVFDLGQDTLICEDFSVPLSVTVAADKYRWQDGTQSSHLRTYGPGLYTVEVTDGPCVATDSILVSTRPCIYFDAYVPNAFSPNGDGINDELKPMLPFGLQITDYQFTIFDRWGRQVFQTTDLDTAWPGMEGSGPLPRGVYVYFVEFAYIDDRGEGRELISGDVMLMR